MMRADLAAPLQTSRDLVGNRARLWLGSHRYEVPQ